ncbi:MAG: peptide chain release factor N(5)-glutamine methyltransferase [Bacteroidales bacterium]|nr:peptide chain release factor N(5)-glutamine methyltransferase [Bacteroidales bacterium]
MLLTQLINKGVEAISALYPEGEAKEMVYAFLEHHVGTKRHTHIIEPAYEVPQEKALQAVAAFERMAAGEPMQYVVGVADFYGRQFRVTPDVLIPRPETELLCREAIIDRTSSDGLESLRILDLCTGSGCIAWTLALEMPGAEVTAVDISDGALAVSSSQDFAQEIARTGACSPTFIKADVLAGPSLTQQYDILVSNPPYVMDKEKVLMRTNVLDHEPHLALFVSDDDPLIFYRAIAQWAQALLKPDGYCIVEINEALGQETAQIYINAGFRCVNVIRDLSDRDRFVSFRR